MIHGSDDAPQAVGPMMARAVVLQIVNPDAVDVTYQQLRDGQTVGTDHPEMCGPTCACVRLEPGALVAWYEPTLDGGRYFALVRVSAKVTYGDVGGRWLLFERVTLDPVQGVPTHCLAADD